MTLLSAANIGVQRDRFFLEANWQLQWIIRPFPEFRHTLHGLNAVAGPVRHAPHCFPPRPQVVVEKQDEDCLSIHLWHESSFDGLLGYRSCRTDASAERQGDEDSSRDIVTAKLVSTGDWKVRILPLHSATENATPREAAVAGIICISEKPPSTRRSYT